MITRRGNWDSRLIPNERRVHSGWNMGSYNLQQGPNARLYFLEPLKTKLYALAVIPLQQLFRQEKRREQGRIVEPQKISDTIEARLREVTAFGPQACRQTVIDEILYSSYVYMVTTETWRSARESKADLTPMHFIVMAYPRSDGTLSLSQTIVWNATLSLDQEALSTASRTLIAHDRAVNPHYFDETNVLKVKFSK